jgi:ethanolamine utilization protein EutQ (cupin superfamily)
VVERLLILYFQDVFYFPKGSKITFKTEDYGLGFFVGQRAEGAA